MAITVVQAPGSVPISFSVQAMHSMHSAMWHIVTSTNVAQPGFRFVFDVYVAGASVPIRLKVSPDSDNKGIVDLSGLVRSYLENYFAPGFNAVAPFIMRTSDIAIPYLVKYGEEFGGVIYNNLFQDGYHGWNSYIGDTPGFYASFPASQFEKQWATNRNIREIRIPKGSTTFLSFINNTQDDVIAEVAVIDEDGNDIDGPYFTDPIIGSRKLMVVNLDPAYINTAVFNSAPSPVIPDNAAGYRITLGVDSGSSQVALVRWLCEPKTPATPVHFLNRAGGFDTFHFTGPTRKELEVSRKMFKPLPAVMGSDGKMREYHNETQVFGDTAINYNTKHTWSRRLSSGFVDDVTQEWLWELVASPQVYIEEGGYFYPVYLKTSRWNERITRFDKMFNLEIEIEMGRQVFSQNR